MTAFTARDLARVLVAGEYPAGDIIAAVAHHFPDEPDVERLVDEAIALKAGLDVDLAARQAADETAAIAAEHDPDKSMHPRRQQ